MGSAVSIIKNGHIDIKFKISNCSIHGTDLTYSDNAVSYSHGTVCLGVYLLLYRCTY